MNLAKGALQVLAAVAPTVASALGGPMAGSAATFLVNWITGIGKVPATASASDKQKAIEQTLLGGDPNAMLELTKVEDSFKTHMAELGVKEEQLAYQDTANARQRQVTMRDWSTSVIGWVFIAATLTLEGLMALGFHKPTIIAPELLGRILGTLDSGTMLILSFHYGSSAGARSNSEALADIAKQP